MNSTTSSYLRSLQDKTSSTSVPGDKNFGAVECVGALVGTVFLVLVCLVATPRIPDVRHRRGAHLRQQLQAQRERQYQKQLADEHPELRSALIEQSLTVKRVAAVHTKRYGSLTLDDMPENGGEGFEGGQSQVEVALDLEESEDSSTSVENDDDDDACTCAICLEHFRVGDTLAWSKNLHGSGVCSHVFHRSCIIQWLQHSDHNDCPSCRAEIIPRQLEKDESCRVEAERERGIFVIINGLVSWRKCEMIHNTETNVAGRAKSKEFRATDLDSQAPASASTLSQAVAVHE